MNEIKVKNNITIWPKVTLLLFVGSLLFYLASYLPLFEENDQRLIRSLSYLIFVPLIMLFIWISVKTIKNRDIVVLKMNEKGIWFNFHNAYFFPEDSKITQFAIYGENRTIGPISCYSFNGITKIDNNWNPQYWKNISAVRLQLYSPEQDGYSRPNLLLTLNNKKGDKQLKKVLFIMLEDDWDLNQFEIYSHAKRLWKENS